MKIALVSTGLGRVLRGFESFTDSLFRALRRDVPDLDVTLFQGGGRAGERRIVIPNFHRDDAPARWFDTYRRGHIEQRSFALCLYPLLRLGGYDIVHYNELVFGSALYHLRRLLGGKFKLLYCNGAPSPPIHYHHRCDFVQTLTGPMLDEALCYGLSKHRVFLVPYGVDQQRFSRAVRSLRMKTRRELGIPEQSTVVLTVAALKREHKRIDHIIREISGLRDPIWLLAAGQRTQETESLELEAEQLLHSRWRFVSWPHDQMARLFGAADVFVLASLTEGLPISSIEAMFTGLPLILHDAPIFRWAAEGAPVRHVNMSAEGELKHAVQEVLSDGNGYASCDGALERFSWQTLVPKYIEMYKRVAEGR